MKDKSENMNHEKLEFTGERYVPEIHGNIELEHLHRYLFARESVKDKFVLDIACGEGYGSHILAEKASRVIGVDISQEAISHAENKYNKDNLEFRVGLCSKIPIDDQSVDVVVSFETIEHHDEHEEMLQEIKRVLKPDGFLVISSPDKYEYSEKSGQTNEYHIKELYRSEFDCLLHNYFKDHRIYGQRIAYGSAIFCEDGCVPVNSYEISNEKLAPIPGVPHAVYLIAIASDSSIPVLGSGILEQPIMETDFARWWQELVDSKEKEIESINHLVGLRDDQIANYKKTLFDQEEKITDFRKMVEQRDSLIVDLQEGVSTELARLYKFSQGLSQHLESINKIIVERDNHIADLKAAVTNQEEKITSLNRMIDQRGFHITRLQKEISVQLERVANLNQEADQRAKYIAELQRTILNKKYRIVDLEKIVGDARALISGAKKITSLQAERFNRIKNIVDEHNGRTIEIENINKKIREDMRFRLNEKNNRVVELEDINNQLAEKIVGMDSEIIVLRESVTNILASRSWRLTSPVRRVVITLRQVKRYFSRLFLYLYNNLLSLVYYCLPFSGIKKQAVKEKMFRFFGFAFSHLEAYKHWKRNNHEFGDDVISGEMTSMQEVVELGDDEKKPLEFSENTYEYEEILSKVERLIDDTNRYASEGKIEVVGLEQDVFDIEGKLNDLLCVFDHQDIENDKTVNSLVYEAIDLPSADGHWEWDDYNKIKSKIACDEETKRSKFLPMPIELVDIANGSYSEAISLVKLPSLVESPNVSIILPVYNNLKLTLECLISISRHVSDKVSFEIIVADDSSTDDTYAVVTCLSNIRYIRNDNNLGFLKNCNNALQHVKGDYVLFLNNDVQVRSGWLDALFDTFSSYENVGAVGPRFLYPSGHLQEAGGSFRGDGTTDMVGLNDDPSRPRYNYVRRVDYVSGACLILPTPLIKKLGGFSEDFLPCYCEDSDLCLRVQKEGYFVYCNPKSEVVHHLSKTTSLMSDDMKSKSISKNVATLQYKWLDYINCKTQPKIISFYLPQFHPVPENDKWWGNGFTEWSNVVKAKSNFIGHYQPRLPAELGYYDLRLADTLIKQAELAKRYGVYGFCFYYYWFAGKRLLEGPVNQMLETGKPDLPFCLCWANENWTRRWDGQDQEILISQSHSPGDDRAVIMDLINYFRDNRYIRIDGRPLILVYRVNLFPDFLETSILWRSVCREQGVGEIYIAMVESMELVHAKIEPEDFGCDAAVEFPPQALADIKSPSGTIINPDFAGHVADYKDIAVSYVTREAPPYTRFMGVMPGWDNTARRQDNSFCFENASPGAFQAWLEEAVRQTRLRNYGDERLIFVNAWNEWAEGAYLEPDKRFGRSYLEAVKNSLDAESLLYP